MTRSLELVNLPVLAEADSEGEDTVSARPRGDVSFAWLMVVVSGGNGGRLPGKTLSSVRGIRVGGELAEEKARRCRGRSRGDHLIGDRGSHRVLPGPSEISGSRGGGGPVVGVSAGLRRAVRGHSKRADRQYSGSRASALRPLQSLSNRAGSSPSPINRGGGPGWSVLSRPPSEGGQVGQQGAPFPPEQSRLVVRAAPAPSGRSASPPESARRSCRQESGPGKTGRVLRKEWRSKQASGG